MLQQTIKRRLPDLDSRLKAAKKALAELEAVNAELRNTLASQSEALKTARGTLHSQRADIERLRTALEAGGVRGSGKVDARAVNESQRLSAELSRTQEELERARTSAEEYAFLRREMTRLAQHILAAARTQGTTVPQQRMVVEVAQAFPQFGGLEAREGPQEPEVPRSRDEWRWKRRGGDGRAGDASRDGCRGIRDGRAAGGHGGADRVQLPPTTRPKPRRSGPRSRSASRRAEKGAARASRAAVEA